MSCGIAPRAFRVRVWVLMSARGRPRRGLTPPLGANVSYALSCSLFDSPTFSDTLAPEFYVIPGSTRRRAALGRDGGVHEKNRTDLRSAQRAVDCVWRTLDGGRQRVALRCAQRW